MTTATKTRRTVLDQDEAARRRQVTVVHSGARDAYQVALALEESGMLGYLVTDLFWPFDRPWARYLARKLPDNFRAQLSARSQPGIPPSRVRLLALIGLVTLVVDKLSSLGILPQSFRRSTMRSADAALGRSAGKLARDNKTALLSYSYYAHDAFARFKGDGILFQLHPHPASMRRILLAELAKHPQCATSLNQEWELALPQTEFDHLVGEPASARHIIAASSFTRSTLIENGIDKDRITVIPYGVDSEVFSPDLSRLYRENDKLRLLFVGRMNQRKGIQYLLDSLALLHADQIELTVCGRVVDDLSIFRPFGDQVRIRPDISRQELIAAYRAADLFVFPSVAEGFGHVLLESMACGLPILSTVRTAAPDLIESGREGFVVAPCETTPIAERIEWALSHRKALWSMRADARHTAQKFNWQRFRGSLAQTVAGYLKGQQTSSLLHGAGRRERSKVHAF